MGQVARYIDTFNDSERDRVIEAQDWGYEWLESAGDMGGNPECKCLVGHRMDLVFNHDSQGIVARAPGIEFDLCGLNGMSEHYIIGMRVPRMFDRFGQDRMVALFKARAAKGHSPMAATEANYSTVHRVPHAGMGVHARA